MVPGLLGTGPGTARERKQRARKKGREGRKEGKERGREGAGLRRSMRSAGPKPGGDSVYFRKFLCKNQHPCLLS
jgi:hypothetical protein